MKPKGNKARRKNPFRTERERKEGRRKRKRKGKARKGIRRQANGNKGKERQGKARQSKVEPPPTFLLPQPGTPVSCILGPSHPHLRPTLPGPRPPRPMHAGPTLARLHGPSGRAIPARTEYIGHANRDAGRACQPSVDF